MKHSLLLAALGIAAIGHPAKANQPYDLGPTALVSDQDDVDNSTDQSPSLDDLSKLQFPQFLANADPSPTGGGHLRSDELPPVNVVGVKPSGLREEDRIGSYNQPRWTATRRFPNTRVYVVPEGKLGVELWFIPRFLKSGETNGRYLAEVTYGLPYRLQLDVYYRLDIDNAGNGQNGAQVEMRWALADWGKIPLNPTLYAEYIYHENDSDAVEFKLLLGDELAPRWHYGVNFVAELEMGGGREYTYEVDAGISYSVIDDKLGIGAEAKYEFTTTRGNRGDPESSLLIGPSFQWKPLPQLSINLAPLFGVTEDSANARVYLNIGWEF